MLPLMGTAPESGQLSCSSPRQIYMITNCQNGTHETKWLYTILPLLHGRAAGAHTSQTCNRESTPRFMSVVNGYHGLPTMASYRENATRHQQNGVTLYALYTIHIVHAG